ncbi:hypothetical protein T484DRAFT_2364562 [Baffinella frigidus]|nr:hypothetical protein T484DRAFT_2364562 [Cryptophyta sp. CCMP2293]
MWRASGAIVWRCRSGVTMAFMPASRALLVKTRNDKPGIINPEPRTREPRSETRDPEPGSRNPEPGIRNPEETLKASIRGDDGFHASFKGAAGEPRNPQSSILNPQLFTRNPHPETRNANDGFHASFKGAAGDTRALEIGTRNPEPEEGRRPCARASPILHISHKWPCPQI